MMRGNFEKNSKVLAAWVALLFSVAHTCRAGLFDPVADIGRISPHARNSMVSLSATLLRNFALPEISQNAPAFNLSYGAGTAAEFMITGEPNAVVVTSLPSSVEMNSTSGRSSTPLVISSLATTALTAPSVPASTFTLNGNGTTTVLVIGCREAVPSNFPRDTYAGTLTISIVYQ